MRHLVIGVWALALAVIGCSQGSGVPGEPAHAPEPTDTAQDPLRCGALRCAFGQTCQDGADGKRCAPADAGGGRPDASAVVPSPSPTPPGSPPSGAGCAATTCPVGSTCYETASGRAECVTTPSCAATTCPVGERCELQEVQCIRAPCPPQPVCVPDPAADPCAAVRCKAGTHCEPKEVQCIRAPCPAVAECVADTKGVPCGASVCGAGQVCCNASCGICTPRGGACIQVACEPKP